MKRVKFFRWLVMALMSTAFGLPAVADSTDDVVTDGGDKLLIELVSGENRIFELNVKPQLLFSADALTVKSEVMETDLPFVYSDIKNISFQLRVPTSVDEMEHIQEKTIFVKFIDSNTFKVYGIDGRLGVMVYSLDGMVMPLDADRGDNAVVVHLNGYRSGTYLIKIGKQTYKVIKR